MELPVNNLYFLLLI